MAVPDSRIHDQGYIVCLRYGFMVEHDMCDSVPGIENKIPKDILKGLMDLRKHESKILSQLNSNPQLAEKFLTNPASALSELGIPVDSKLNARLKSFSKDSFVQDRTFCLPNGTKVSPKINVKFIAHEDGRGE